MKSVLRKSGCTVVTRGFISPAPVRYDPLVRHVRRLLKGLGLLIGVALLAGWVRSFFVSDELRYAWSDPVAKSIGSGSVALSRGWLLVEWQSVKSEDPSGIVVLPKWSHWTRDRFPPDPLALPDAHGRAETARYLGIRWSSQRHSSARPAEAIDEEGPVTRPIHGGRMVAVQVWSQRAVLLPWLYLFVPLLAWPAIRLARRARAWRRQESPPTPESTAIVVRTPGHIAGETARAGRTASPRKALPPKDALR
jgi:hypothetical protein